MSTNTIQELLALIEKPSRYLGSEINAVRKDPSRVKLRMALAFPDLYEIGTSHFGLQILYHILNRRPEIAADGRTLERFSHELKTVRKIIHKNVGRMHDLAEDRGSHYITMEYISGQDLKGLIRQTGRLTVSKAMSLAKQICAGLAEAHRLGIVHRDLKPGNIMIDREGNARIMDFGLALSFAGGQPAPGLGLVGTPAYMSPEQLEGLEVDPRTDVYALGVLLFEMLTGRRPFAGDTPAALAQKHKSEFPPDPLELNPQIPPSLSRLILRCLEKAREKRPSDAAEILSELDRIESDISTEEMFAPVAAAKPEKSKPRRVGRPALGAFLVLAAAAAAIAILGGRGGIIESIAVLPFETQHPAVAEGPESDYLSEGITEGIISRLTLLPSLKKVIAMSSVLRYRGKTADPQTGTIPTRRVGEEFEAAVEVPTSGKGFSFTGRAVGEVLFTNLLGQDYRVPEDSVVRTTSGSYPVRYRTTAEIVIPAFGQATAPVEALEEGPSGNVNAYQINLVEGVVGFAVRVTNPSPISGADWAMPRPRDAAKVFLVSFSSGSTPHTSPPRPRTVTRWR